MSDAQDHDSRTEEPTEKKLHDALERGDTPVSREVGVLAAMTASFVILSLLLPRRAEMLATTLVQFVDDPAGWRLDSGADALALARQMAMAIAAFLWPIVAVLAATGIAASVAQNVPRFAPERIMPNAARISPRRGLSRIFGFRGWTEFLKSVAKLAAVLGLVALAMSAARGDLITAMYADVSDLPNRVLSIAVRAVAAVMTATLVVAFADLAWSRMLWRRDQRMTRQEVKEELRQAEGDRLIKSRLRSLRMDRARRRMLSAVPRATMVIVNPTHYSVALRYVRQEGGAPIVLAKGMDLVALRIREIAESEGIPIVEDRILARSLYAAAVVDAAIPPEFYRAVAEIVHAIRAHKGSGPINRNG